MKTPLAQLVALILPLASACVMKQSPPPRSQPTGGMDRRSVTPAALATDPESSAPVENSPEGKRCVYTRSGAGR